VIGTARGLIRALILWVTVFALGLVALRTYDTGVWWLFGCAFGATITWHLMTMAYRGHLD
jgi:hypothetical protein